MVRRSFVRRGGLAVVALGFFSPAMAFAAEPAPAESRQALAEALFQEARDLSAQGKSELACPKFAESQRLDPATGTLLNLATCHENTGKLATAWSEFNQALAAAQRDGRDDRVRFARDHIRTLETKLSHVIIRVRPDHGATNLEIRIDDVTVGRAAWGTPLPADPGKHVVRAQAPGSVPWQTEITVGTHAQDIAVEVPEMEHPAHVALAATAESAASENRNRRTMMLVSAGVGATGIVAGSAFGLYAFRRWHDAEQACPSGRGCNQSAIDARSSASNAAIASDVAFGVGIVCVGAAAYLWLTTPRSSTSGAGVHVQAMPVVGPGTMGMAMEGQF